MFHATRNVGPDNYSCRATLAPRAYDDLVRSKQIETGACCRLTLRAILTKCIFFTYCTINKSSAKQFLSKKAKIKSEVKKHIND